MKPLQKSVWSDFGAATLMVRTIQWMRYRSKLPFSPSDFCPGYLQEYQILIYSNFFHLWCNELSFKMIIIMSKMGAMISIRIFRGWDQDRTIEVHPFLGTLWEQWLTNHGSGCQNLLPVFVNKVLGEQNHAHSFTCRARLLLYRVEYLWQIHDLQCLNYLLLLFTEKVCRFPL